MSKEILGEELGGSGVVIQKLGQKGRKKTATWEKRKKRRQLLAQVVSATAKPSKKWTNRGGGENELRSITYSWAMKKKAEKKTH